MAKRKSLMVTEALHALVAMDALKNRKRLGEHADEIIREGLKARRRKAVAAVAATQP